MRITHILIIGLWFMLTQITLIYSLAHHRVEITKEIENQKIEIMNETNLLTQCLIFHRCPPEHS